MKIKKSKFAKLLALTLPIAAISIVTPVVLTSCGSSNSTTTPDKPDNGGSGGGSDTGGGGSSGDGGTSGGGSGSQTPSVVTTTWDSSKLNGIDGVAYNSDNKTVTITLGSSSFNDTGLTKTSTLDAIKKSLTPTSESSSVTKSSAITKDKEQTSPTKTLYSLLSPAITNEDKFNVSVNINPNDVVFDYTNDNVANTINGQFVLTPKSKTNDENSQNNQTLNFTIQNFNDSNNKDKDQKTLSWDVNAISTALSSKTEGTGNKLPDVAPKDNGASVTINLTSDKVGLGKVMDELSNTSISSDELKPFIKGIDDTNFDFSKVSISNWAPSVDGTEVFTRIIIPTKDGNGPEAILYIAYVGITSDPGNGAWNRNIAYPDASKSSENLWDLIYKDPVIDLSKIDGGICGITSSSTKNEIIAKKDDISKYMTQNYILGYNKFTIPTDKETCTPGSFDGTGNFKKSQDSKSTTDSLKNNNNVIMFQFVIQPTTTTSATLNTSVSGIYRSFYITGFSNDK